MQLHVTTSAALPKLRGTLILATEGPGNVGQLAVDLVLSTWRAVHVGWLDEDTLLPAVGNAGGPGNLALGLELWQLPNNQAVFLLQQRAPAAPGAQHTFAAHLAAWVHSAGFEQVLLLGSLDATLRRDAQLAGTQLRSWSQDVGLQERCSSCGLPPLEETWFSEQGIEEQLLPPWPAQVQLRQLGLGHVAALLIFAAEGENLADAHVLAAAAARAGGLVAEGDPAEPRWVPPESWQWVFGCSVAVY